MTNADRFAELSQPSSISVGSGALEDSVVWALRILHELPDDLNVRFFEPRNVTYLQKRITADVKKITRFAIKDQPADALLQIMVGMYQRVRGSRRSTTLETLNNAVLKECVKQCLTYIRGYEAYIRDATTQVRPMDRGVNPSIKGTDPLPGFLPMA